MAKLPLRQLRLIHLMTKGASMDPASPMFVGNWRDVASGKGYKEIEVQVLGYHDSREFVRRDRTPTEHYPEIEKIEKDSLVCASSNGVRATAGLYIGTECNLCPHSSQRCPERSNVIVRLANVTDDRFREILFKGPSLTSWTDVLLDIETLVAQPYQLVIKLSGEIIEYGEGKAALIVYDGYREATPEEVAAAEAMMGRVATLLKRIQAGDDTRALTPASEADTDADHELAAAGAGPSQRGAPVPGGVPADGNGSAKRGGR